MSAINLVYNHFKTFLILEQFLPGLHVSKARLAVPICVHESSINLLELLPIKKKKLNSIEKDLKHLLK